MRKGRTALWMLLCSVCTAVMLIYWPDQMEESVETALVQSGELVQTVLLNGTVQYDGQSPCVSLRSGVISKVHVEAGQTVHRGDLLFSLDTQMEEQALASLYQRKHAQEAALKDMDGAVSALALQSELEWMSSERELLASVEASRIRAEADGVMEAVYIRPDDYVSEAALLGLMRGDGQHIAAAASGATGVSPGAAAVVRDGDESYPAVLKRMDAPDGSTGIQMLYFEALDHEKQDELSQGESLEIEMTTAVYPESALVPLSAVDADGLIWIVRDGKAYQHRISLDLCSRSYAAAPMELAGSTVIVYPERHVLEEGMPVRGM